MFIQIYGRNLRVQILRTWPVTTKSPVVRMMRKITIMEKKTFKDKGKRAYTKEIPRTIILTQPIELGREWRVMSTPYFDITPVVWLAKDSRRKPTWTLTPRELMEGILRYNAFSEPLIKSIDWPKAKVQATIIKLINLWGEYKFSTFHAGCKELLT